MIFKEQTKSIPITRMMVWEAYQKVKRNKGSAGVDQQTLDDFDKARSKELYKIWNRLTSGSYFPPEVKRVAIRKQDGKTRPLGIPTVRDRIAQQVIKTILEPRLEVEFLESSYGYRPKKSALSAVRKVQENVRKLSWVIDLDIKEFFENVNHELLFKALKLHVSEKWVLLYIRRWLEAPVQLPDGTSVPSSGKGTPQLHTVKSFNELKEVIRIRSDYYPTNYMDCLLLDNKKDPLSKIVKIFRKYAEPKNNYDFKTVPILRKHIKYRENHDDWIFNTSGDPNDPIVTLVGFNKK